MRFVVIAPVFISSSAAHVSGAVSGPAPPTWREWPSTAHVTWMRHVSGARPPTWERPRCGSMTLAVPGRSGERLWLVTWTAQGRSRDLCHCYTCQMFDSHFLVVYFGPVSEKSLCDQNDDMSEEGYYYPFFWLVFINKNIGAQVAQWVKRWPTDLADRVRSSLKVKSSQP